MKEEKPPIEKYLRELLLKLNSFYELTIRRLDSEAMNPYNFEGWQFCVKAVNTDFVGRTRYLLPASFARVVRGMVGQ